MKIILWFLRAGTSKVTDWSPRLLDAVQTLVSHHYAAYDWSRFFSSSTGFKYTWQILAQIPDDATEVYASLARTLFNLTLKGKDVENPSIVAVFKRMIHACNGDTSFMCTTNDAGVPFYEPLATRKRTAFQEFIGKLGIRRVTVFESVEADA
jgi:hypothetical protein